MAKDVVGSRGGDCCCFRFHFFYTYYSWPLNNAGVWGANTLHRWKSMYNFWHPPNWTGVIPLVCRGLVPGLPQRYSNAQMLKSPMWSRIIQCMQWALCASQTYCFPPELVGDRGYRGPAIYLLKKSHLWVDLHRPSSPCCICLLYTSDAADEERLV